MSLSILNNGLSALNSPPLVASLGVVAATLGQGTLERLPFFVNNYKIVNVLAYVLNVIAVSLPGRFDGEVARELQEREKSGKGAQGVSKEAKMLTPVEGRTLVAPSGWAFAIWGPIFLGELVFVISQFFSGKDSPVSNVIKNVSAPFVLAQVFQALWSASFRPKYKGNLMFISAGMLGGIATFMGKAQAIFSAASGSYSVLQYLLYFFPMALHFGWTTAATLVNINGAVAMNEKVPNKAVTWVGHLSVVAATALGVFVTWSRSAPVYGGVISWALFAVADGMKSRYEALSNTKKSDNMDEDLLKDVSNQRRLSTLGAYISAGASVLVSMLSTGLFGMPVNLTP